MSAQYNRDRFCENLRNNGFTQKEIDNFINLCQKEGWIVNGSIVVPKGVDLHALLQKIKTEE